MASDQEPSRPEADSLAGKRQVSTISFPYLDLEAAVEVAHAMYKTRGHSAMAAHELAGTLGQTISGNFRLKTGTTKTFGLSEREGRDHSKLTKLGLSIIEPATEREARADAFLEVPLYRAIYEKYKGQRLPPPKALEREMETLGVSGKQTDKARQAFERSAKQAGYFAQGEDRLVRPIFSSEEPIPNKIATEPARREEAIPQTQQAEPAGSGGQHHPLIQGLLITLPPIGDKWVQSDRKAWLTMASSIFDMIYKSEEKSASQNPNTASDQ